MSRLEKRSLAVYIGIILINQHNKNRHYKDTGIVIHVILGSVSVCGHLVTTSVHVDLRALGRTAWSPLYK